MFNLFYFVFYYHYETKKVSLFENNLINISNSNVSNVTNMFYILVCV